MVSIMFTVLLVVILIVGFSYMAGVFTGRAYERRNIHAILEKYYEQNENAKEEDY